LKGASVNFTGKRVLITGSTDGIGRAAAELFLAADAHVAINGKTTQSVTRAVREMAGPRALAVPGDVSSVEACRSIVTSAVEGLGGLDCLVNSVEICPTSRMSEVSEAHWDEVIAANLRSAMFCTVAALPALRRSKGNVVIVSSVAALTAGPTDRFVYSVSKAGLIGMTRTLALELAADGVRVNCVCPGHIDTPQVRAQDQAGQGQLEQFVRRATPLGRLGTPRECASAIAYLASEDSGYCTGSTIVIDGGCLAQASWGARPAN
jgi:NAD(P)-dependent dehydrogenase (short-subunit alcohol dehydrogenase family)